MANRKRLPARRVLGRDLRSAREAKGLKPSDIACRMNVSESLVNAWESGRQQPTSQHFPTLIKILDVSLDDLLRTLGEIMDNETSPEWTDKWRSVEDNANVLRSYEHSVVPGLLQTAEYATAVIQQHQPQADVSDKVAARLERQKILRKDDAPTVVLIINERVLYNRVGGASVMLEQMRALLEASELPNIIIHIVEDDEGYHPGHAGAFMIARLIDDNGDPRGVVYQDGASRGHVFEDEHEVAEFERTWLTIQSAALSKKMSLALIRQAVERWNNEVAQEHEV